LDLEKLARAKEKAGAIAAPYQPNNSANQQSASKTNPSAGPPREQRIIRVADFIPASTHVKGVEAAAWKKLSTLRVLSGGTREIVAVGLIRAVEKFSRGMLKHVRRKFSDART
jgi:hypothetical protein